MKNTNEQNELIVIKQLPVIEDHLLAVKASIEERVKTALSLVCTEETYKDVKKVRSDLNKEFAELEAKRKAVKAEIMKPYELFESVYRDCAGDIYTLADQKLRVKISEVEDGLKQQKAVELERYFNEYCTSLHFPDGFITFDRVNIKIGMSDSKTALRKQITALLDQIAADLKAIESRENYSEVLVEYKRDYCLSHAILTVETRHKEVEAETARQAAMAAEKAAAEAAAAAVKAEAEKDIPHPVSVPVAVQTEEQKPEELLTVAFRVTGTREKLKALKAFLNEGGYTYDC